MKKKKIKFEYKCNTKTNSLYGGDVSKFALSKSNLFYGTSDEYEFSKGWFINSLLLINVIDQSSMNTIDHEDYIWFTNETADKVFAIIVKIINEIFNKPSKINKKTNDITWALTILQLKRVGFYLNNGFLNLGFLDDDGSYKFYIVWSDHFNQWHQISSTNIECFYYCLENYEFCFKFWNSEKYYIYNPVEPFEYINFINAEDPGVYFANEIKNKYDYKVVSERPY